MKFDSQNSSDLQIFLESCRSVNDELSCDLEIVEGKIPATLQGILYRNGPGRFEVGQDKYSHLFDGDGMISRFQISSGRVSYRNSYVKTAEFLEENNAGRMLYRGFGSNLPGGLLKNAFRTHFKNAANTNVISHAGQLLALWEGGWPHRLSADTLETLGRYNFEGQLKNKFSRMDEIANPELPFSAHPKVDPTTGNLYNFGLAFGLKNRLMIYKVTPDGKMQEPRYINLNDLSFIHDFQITAGSKAIFFCTPVHFSLMPMLAGLTTPAGGMTSNPGEPVRIFVIDLEGPPGEIPDSDIEVFETPHAFVFHHVGAFEEAGQIHIYSAEMDSFPSAESAERALKGIELNYPLTQLAHTILIPGERRARKEVLPIKGFELPRLDDSRTGMKFTSFFAAGVSEHRTFPLMDQIQRVSTSGTIEAAFTYREGAVGEPVFVKNAQDEFVLSVCYNAESKRSELVVLHAQDLALVARAQLPHSQPLGFHGNWVS